MLPLFWRSISRWEIARLETGETRKTSATSFHVNPLRELLDMALLLLEMGGSQRIGATASDPDGADT